VQSIRIAAALLLPWAAGALWLRLLWRTGRRAHWAVLLGYGYLVGMFATTVMMRCVDFVGLGQSYLGPVLALGAATVVALWLGRCLPWAALSDGESRESPGDRSWPVRLAVSVVLALLLVRFGTLAAEVVWRPLYPWDAWMNWAPKARVWFELKHLAAFGPENAWLAQPDSEIYSIVNWKYPPAVPLVQTWMALALGRWDDSLVNLPWLACAVALGLGFYGQARVWGVARLAAVLFTYFLLSMPLLDTHVALAGYADLWMAAYYGLAALALFQWLRTREPGQAWLAAACALAATQVKMPGIVWDLTLLPGLAVALLPKRWLIALLFLATGSVSALALTGGITVDIPLLGPLSLSLHEIRVPYLGHYALEFHPVWRSFYEHGWLLASWHLLWYLIPVLLLASIHRVVKSRLLRAMTATVAAGFAFLGVVFFFTRDYAFAIDSTTINRAVMHFVPVVLFYGLAAFWEGRSQAPSAAR
jgi:hypothetical protein